MEQPKRRGRPRLSPEAAEESRNKRREQTKAWMQQHRIVYTKRVDIPLLQQQIIDYLQNNVVTNEEFLCTVLKRLPMANKIRLKDEDFWFN